MNPQSSLVEMGITPEVAQRALEQTNGDLEAAVNYIFSGEVYSAQPTEAVHSAPMPGFTPGSLTGVMGQSQDGDDDTDSSSSEQELSPPFSPRRSPDFPTAGANSNGVLDSPRKALVTDPTVVTPLPHSLFENYFALFSLAMCQYLPQILAKPELGDLSYDPKWAQGVCSTTTSLIEQLQRLSGVVNASLSDRCCVSARIIAAVLDASLRRKLSEAEHLHEVLPSFIRSLIHAIERSGCFGDEQVRSLFVSSALSSEGKSLLSVLQFMPEEYESSLYAMFNALLYPELDEGEENGNSLLDVAPFLTIVFDEMDEDTEVTSGRGVDIPLEFYPQLYTKKVKDALVRPLQQQRRAAQERSRQVLAEMNSLKSYQGKDILKFINSALDYLQRDGQSKEAVDQLEQLKNSISEHKTQRKNEYKELSQKLHGEWNLSHPTYLIDEAKERDLVDEPYLLVLAVLHPGHYFQRSRSGQWKSVRADPNLVRLSDCAPEQVQTIIRHYTTFPSKTPLMLLYVKQSHVPEDAIVLKSLESNKGISSFLRMDQEELNRDYLT
ncbi:related to UBA domain-containing protein RUP1 [Zygosaccharomyces bailii ISA1307]|nr:related to UBA domain-containing protein RUP1 [Zygosaccharomyces bailii ISA1307]